MHTATHEATAEAGRDAASGTDKRVLVSVENLAKSFDARVLKGINLKIEPGHIVGLIGSNSGGKSTLLRHMVGIYLPDTGTCHTLGIEAARLGPREFNRIGYVHQEGELPGWMQTAQLIRYVAAHYARWNRALELQLLDYLELDIKERVGRLSPGQRQKLSILLAVCFEPELLILDEPASALDPIARRKFLELLMGIIQDQNRTIIISSHILSDIEKVIDHVLILERGELLRDCRFDDLLEEFIKLEITAPSGTLPEASALPDTLFWEADAYRAVAVLKRTKIDPDALALELNCHVQAIPLTLEEIYPLVLSKGQRSRLSGTRLSGGF
jgi:ABC-2 type transport system ATP-binding protein